MKKKKILGLMLEVGDGHKSQAMAVANAIENQYPGQFELEVLDTFKDIGAFRLDGIYKDSWRKTLRLAPVWQKLLYQGWRNRIFVHGLERLLGIQCLNRLYRHIRAANPDLIFVTHFTVAHYVSIMKRRGWLDIPVVVLHSEPFDTFAAWQYHTVDNYICYSETVRRKLARTCRCNDLGVFPFPLRPIFNQEQNNLEQKSIREKLGLDADMLTMLFTCGGEGVGSQSRYIKTLLRTGLPLQIAVICGRNQSLMHELAALAPPPGAPTQLRPFGFVSNMNEFILASDFVVGKAGPATTLESLVLHRPVIHIAYLPQEAGIMRLVAQNKLGWFAPSPQKLLAIVESIIDDPAVLDEARRRIAAYGFSNGSVEIANYIVELLNRTESQFA